MMQITIQCKKCMSRMVMDGDVDDVDFRKNIIRIRAYCPVCTRDE